MYQTTPPVNLAEFGLILDEPSNNTPANAWSNSLNLRAKDNSVQGVYKFEDTNFGLVAPTTFSQVTTSSKIMACVQWTPSGTDFLNIAYVVEDDTSKGRVFVHNTNTNTTVEITNALLAASFTLDDKYPPQIFVFNELLIVNPATGTPQYISADATTSGTLQDIPGWLTYTTNMVSYPAIARVIRPFNNRLIAMSFVDDKNTASTTDDTFNAIDIAWSSNITGLGNLTGAEWVASSGNTAGDAFLTSTPGKILDGRQLGEFFIAYKTDAAVRVTEIGQPLILGFEPIFEDDGIFSSRCVASIGNSQHLVLGNYGVYLHNGQTEQQDLGKGKFQDGLYAAIKPADRDRAFLFRQTRDKEVWLCYSNLTNSGNGCNEAIVFDYGTGKIHKRTLPNITDLYEAEINGLLEIFGTSPDGALVQKLSVTTYESDGFLEITDKGLQDPGITKEVNKILVDSEENVKISFVGTRNIKETKTFPTDITFNPASNYKVDVRDSGRYLNLKVTMDSATNPMLTTVAFSVKLTGIR